MGEAKPSSSGQVGPPKVSHLETRPEAYARRWQTERLNISWLAAEQPLLLTCRWVLTPTMQSYN